jgi:hypothetical protein
VLGYGACSATLLVINKLAVSQVPAPGFILVCQMSSSVLAVFAMAALGLLPTGALAPFELAKARAFAPISLLFFACLYTNVRALRAADVDTIIAFRACSPLAVVLADYRFRGRALPSARAGLALLGIVAGVALFVSADGRRPQAASCVVIIFENATLWARVPVARAPRVKTRCVTASCRTLASLWVSNWKHGRCYEKRCRCKRAAKRRAPARKRRSPTRPPRARAATRGPARTSSASAPRWCSRST